MLLLSSRRRLGQEGLSLVVVADILVLGLEELDELVEASGEGGAWFVGVRRV